MAKTILKVTEKVKINNYPVTARIDTGAEYNSIGSALAKKLKLNKPIKYIRIRTSTGTERRPVVKAKLKIKSKTITSHFNIADRKKMKYNLLIGRRTLRNGFLIDPSK